MDTKVALLNEAEAFVRQIFEEQVPAVYYYHDLHHTLSVVAAVDTIAAAYPLTEEDKLALRLAAWFHDTGYSRTYQEHEEASAQIAADFLRARQASDDLVVQVREAIMATHVPQSPKNLVSEILCDADMYHLGSAAFDTENKLLRKELNTVFNKDIGKKEWKKMNLDFIGQHRFFTSYAREHMEPVKQEHRKRLMEGKSEAREKEEEKSKLKEAFYKKITAPSSPAPDLKVPPREEIDKEQLRSQKEKQARTERGITTMFRIMSENHINLSQMADSKANIMISVNTIVLSILVSVFFGKLQYYPQFIIPTVILVVGCLLAVVFAILATRPNITKGVFTAEDIRQKKVNLLFFGNFFKMDLPDYEWAMKAMMNDQDYLYGSMIKDIHSLGQVLARKYRFLRISYNIFMFGLVLAIIAYGVAGIVGTK
ncbi:MAG TPA: DUF5706 domain-containing protein [Flavihumibacter sp.]|nr:DUF5706 domain-containing protein [Flavihumibacter sp.]HPZ86659.1 DUF5706 domain-containing protein [Flavihumibacter sp.]HQD08132.1 DUF5706 domain-containing protein [Flavihumibacter sp.]